MTAEYIWTDNPTVNGVAECDTDVLNDCLMHLKYTKTIRNTGSTETSLIPLDDADIHLYNGSLLSGDGAYGDFVDFMAEKYHGEGVWGVNASVATQRIPSSTYNSNWHILKYYDNKFIALNQRGYISTSTNGIDWTTPSLITTTDDNAMRGMAYGSNIYVIIANYGYVTTSTDGSTWTKTLKSNLVNYSWSDIVFAGNKFIAIGSTGSGSGYITTSTDGLTWSNPTQVSNLSSFSDCKLIYKNGVIYAYSGGYISTSSNGGTTWSTPTANTNFNSFFISSIACNDDKFLAILHTSTQYENGYISFSFDGLTWTTPVLNQNLINNYYYYEALVSDGNKFIALNTSRYQSNIEFYYDAIFTTEQEWQDCVNSSGQCGKFVWDSENDTLRLPKLDERVDDNFKSPVNNYVVVGTSVKQDIEVNLDKVATDLTGKADVDLSNVSGKSGFRKLTAIYNDGTDWYKVYSEYNTTTGEFIGKWCEQGGFLDTQATTSNIALLKPYKTGTYHINLTCKYTTNAYAPCVVSQSADSFQLYVTAVGYDVYWEAKGYIS